MSKKKIDRERRFVSVVVMVLDRHSSFEELCRRIDDAKNRVEAEGLQDAYFDIETTEGYYHEVSIAVRIMARRFETDEEMALRIQEQEQENLQNAEWVSRQVRSLTKGRKRQIYEELKQQFEKE